MSPLPPQARSKFTYPTQTPGLQQLHLGVQRPLVAPTHTPPIQILQPQINLMLQSISQVLLTTQGKTDERRNQLNNRLYKQNIHYQDNLDRIEDDLNRSRAILRRDYALFMAEQAQREMEQAASKEREMEDTSKDADMMEPLNSITTTDLSTISVTKTDSGPPSNRTSPPLVSLSPNSSTPKPNTAALSKEGALIGPDLDLDFMLKQLDDGSPADPPTHPADIDLTFDHTDMSSLLPGVENYTNLPLATHKKDHEKDDKTEEAQETDANGGLGDGSDDMGSMDQFDDLFNADYMDFEGDGTENNEANGILDSNDLMNF